MKTRVELVGSLAGLAGDNVGNIAVGDGFVCLASQLGGLRLVEIGPTSQPKLVARWKEANVVTAAVCGDRVYVATDAGAIVVLDVSRRDQPKRIAVHPTGRRIHQLVLAGPLLVAIDRSGITTFDAAASELGRCDLSLASGAAVAGSRAYVAADFNGLRVVDVSDPARPHELASCEKMANATRVAVREDRAYVVDYEMGVWVVDVSQPEPRVIAQLGEGEGLVGDVALVGRHLCVACGALQVYDVATGEKPRLLTSIEPDCAIWSLAADDARLYALGEGAELRIFSIA